MTQRLVSSASIETPTGSYSAAEADFAVQELGLISMRKRNLAEQVAALGKSPAAAGGRAQEHYEELLEREVKLRKLLDEMQSAG